MLMDRGSMDEFAGNDAFLGDGGGAGDGGAMLVGNNWNVEQLVAIARFGFSSMVQDDVV